LEWAADPVVVAAEDVTDQGEGGTPRKRADKCQDRKLREVDSCEAGGKRDVRADHGKHPSEKYRQQSPAAKPSVGQLEVVTAAATPSQPWLLSPREKARCVPVGRRSGSRSCRSRAC